MEVYAKLKYTRTAPRKVRLIADLIRGKKAEDARNILSFTINKSAGTFLKLLNQAITSAKNNFQGDINNLYISKVIVDGGPILKRFRPRARGSAYRIEKKTSHITLVLREIKEREGRTENISKKEIKQEQKQEEVLAEDKGVKEKKIKKTVSSIKDSQKPKTEKVQNKIFRRQTF
jgi:large subunit ribosomal protein L22